MFALSYARHIPAHARVGRFVADDPRLSLAFALLKDFPEADVLITGGTARDAILGRVPHHVHLTAMGIPESELSLWRRDKRATDLDIRLPGTTLWRPETRTLEERRHHTLPLVHDLARRDATINAMAYSIRDGVLHDPFDGLRDLDEKKLRTLGNPEERFQEDPIRMLRFVRLAAHLGFTIEDQALHAIRKLGKSLNRLTNDDGGHARYHIPRVHLGREFLAMISENAHHAVRHLFSAGIMEHLSPELAALPSLVTQKGVPGHEHAETVLQDLSEHGANPGVTLATLLAILEDESHAAFQKTTERLHLPLLHEGKTLVETVSHLLRHRNVLLEEDPDLLPAGEFEHVFGGERGNDLLLFLHALAVTGSHDSLTRERWYKAKRRKESLASMSLPSLVRGRDLLSLGLVPGPHLRDIMKQIRTEQLEGHIETKADALAFARQLV